MNTPETVPDLYSLKLHEILTTAFLEIRRVPGGWIYTCQAQTVEGDWTASSCFVPYSDDLRPALDSLPGSVAENAKGGLCYQHLSKGTEVMVSRDHDPDDKPIAELRYTTKRGWVLWEIAPEDTLSTEEVVAIGAKLQELREKT